MLNKSHGVYLKDVAKSCGPRSPSARIGATCARRRVAQSFHPKWADAFGTLHELGMFRMDFTTFSNRFKILDSKMTCSRLPIN